MSTLYRKHHSNLLAVAIYAAIVAFALACSLDLI